MNIWTALIHLFSLISLFGWGLRGRHFGRVEIFLLIYLFVWADFVFVGYTMSLFSVLGNPALFVILTVSYAAVACPLLRMISPLPSEDKNPRERSGEKKSPQRALLLFFLVSAFVALVCNVAIAFSVYPNNPDSLAYRLPRVFFYLEHGSFSHFANGVDPRLLYYPENGVLLYAFIVYHRLGPWAFSLVSCVSWAVIGASTYSACRSFKVSNLGSVGTAWIVCFAPNVLAQATSTNDEIVAAAPLLIAMPLAYGWLQTRHTSHLLLAALAVGISLGTKLHFLFYWPLAIIVGLGCAFYLFLRRDAFWMIVKPLLLPAVLACGIISIESLPFAAYNLSSKGQILNKAMVDAFSNKPFDLRVGLQNMALYGSQMLFSPVLDLNINSDTDSRRACYDRLNRFCNKNFFGWVNPDKSFMGFGYRFQGIWSFYSYYLSEESVFLGFTPVLFILGLLCLPRASSKSRLLMGGLLASFWTYFITYSMSTKYIETTGIYFAYACMVGSPGLAVLWLPVKSRKMNWITTGVIGVVLATNLILAANLLKNNVMRNLTQVGTSKPEMLGSMKVGRRIKTELKAAHRLRLVYTHWELSFYSLMHVSPGTLYNTENAPTADGGKALNIYSFLATPVWGSIPVKVYDNGGHGLTYLGIYNSCTGPEYAFASGDNVAHRYPGDSGYIVLHATIQKTEKSFKVSVAPTIDGCAEADKLRFRYTLTSGNNVLSESEWRPDSATDLSVNASQPNDLNLDVQVNLAGQEKTAGVRFPLTGANPILTDRR